MAYSHRFAGTAPAGMSLPPAMGKVVCVGRNYAAHARELGNPVPRQPLLFIKPATAVVPFAEVLAIPRRFASPHYETEIAVLIGRSLCCCDGAEARAAIAGLGVGLDLTLRELQSQLKAQGHPWERAKAFDGSCALSPFTAIAPGLDLGALELRLWRNGELVQQGSSGQMLFPILDLLCDISAVFTLLPGDVVMTGTPEGVGQLADGDHLVAQLDQLVRVESRVAFT